MVIERRSEAVQKAHGTESWASLARPVTVTGRARRSTKQSFDLFEEDSREGRDCLGPVSEEASQPLRDGDHPLPHGHRGNDAVDEMRSCLCHPAALQEGQTPRPLHEKARQSVSRKTVAEVPLTGLFVIESQAPRHDGKKTDGGTLKNLARATMWLLVISRSPVRIAESVDCEIPTAFESAICL